MDPSERSPKLRRSFGTFGPLVGSMRSRTTFQPSKETLMKRLYCMLLLACAGPLASAHEAHVGASGRPPEQLGSVSFPTSCDPAVQAQFERGVALLHSFWFPEGLNAFRAVAAQDPQCAMANWG